MLSLLGDLCFAFLVYANIFASWSSFLVISSPFLLVFIYIKLQIIGVAKVLFSRERLF